MKKSTMWIIIRSIFSIIIVHQIYLETGLFTALFASIMAFESEMNSLIFRKIGKSLKNGMPTYENPPPPPSKKSKFQQKLEDVMEKAKTPKD